MRNISIIPIKTPIIKEGDDVVSIIIDNIPVKLRKGDVLVVATKPLLLAYSKYFSAESCSLDVSAEAKKIAKEYELDEVISELIVRYSDAILGGTKGFILSNVDGVVLPNGGIDRKNIGRNRYALPYIVVKEKAREFYSKIYKLYGVRIGVIISDSSVYPLRLGTRAIAVVTYGFIPVRKYVGSLDLYGVSIRYTYMNIADELASAAHLAMGEGDERVPAALIRGVEVNLVDRDTTYMTKIDPDMCVFKKLYT